MPTHQLQCLGLEYIEGDWKLVQGIKNYQTDRTYADGRRLKVRGFGWGEVSTKSQLILTLSALPRKRKNLEVDVAPFFKKNFGRLVKNRRKVLEDTLPQEINVTVDENGVVIDENDLRKWLEEATKLYPAKPYDAAAAMAKVEVGSDRKTMERFREREAAWEAIQRSEQAERNRQQEERRLAPKISFRKGYNRKHQRDQWEAHSKGRLLVLRQEDFYQPTMGEVPIREIMELVPGRVILVEII